MGRLDYQISRSRTKGSESVSTLGLNEVKDDINFDILEIKLDQCDLEKL